MVICFECSRETKEYLDRLVSSGGFADISEVIAVAIANQALLHRSTESPSLLVAGDVKQEVAVYKTSSEVRSPSAKLSHHVFALRTDIAQEPKAPTPKLKREAYDRQISQADWIFGQHNKLLPVKASCRAIANLINDARGVFDVEDLARSVSAFAGELGTFLQSLDEKYKRVRDEMLSVAFPGRANPDKGRIRYANQFVAGLTKAGEITGLLVDLALLNKLEPSGKEVSLTDAGWRFAVLPNPVLDGDGNNPESKFSTDERKFLVEHIFNAVPVERSAFGKVLAAIHAGHDNPEQLRAAFNKSEKETEKTRSYFATQRSGVLSRLVDLDLLRREWEGVRVRYALTDDGAAFLNR